MLRALPAGVLFVFMAVALAGCPGDGSDATTGSDSGGTPGSDSGGVPGTDSGGLPGTDSGSMPGTDAGAVFTPCMSNGDCPPTWECQVPLCPPGATVGFCYDPSWNTFCGGFGNIMCPAMSLTSCFEHAGCVADAGGVCLTAAQQAAICAAQPNNWACP